MSEPSATEVVCHAAKFIPAISGWCVLLSTSTLTTSVCILKFLNKNTCHLVLLKLSINKIVSWHIIFDMQTVFGSLEWNAPQSEYLHFLHFLICLSSLNITYDYHSHHLKVHHGFKHPCEYIEPYVTKTHDNAICKDLITLLLSCLLSFLSISQYPFTNLLFSPHSDSHLLAFAMNLPQIQTPLTPHKFSPPCLNLSHFSASYSAKLRLPYLPQTHPHSTQPDHHF